MKSTKKTMVSTNIENRILDKIITSNFTKRELKVLLLIMRFSFGLNRDFAVFDKKDFFLAGILPYHVDDILKGLVVRGVIKWNPDSQMFGINKNLKEWVDRRQRI